MVRCPWMIGGLTFLAAMAWGAENAAEFTLVYPCRLAAGPIQVDGRLDPAEWAGAIEVSGFRISGSETLAPEQVVMRLLYDPQNLYVGVKCLESNMQNLTTPTTQTDGPFWMDDSVEFFLDPHHDHETYWQFAATARAVRYDNKQGDSLWNSHWTAAAQHDPDAWTVEAAVPFADLKVAPPAAGDLWGFNLCRERQAGGRLELYNWADVQRVFQNPPRFGHLYFVEAHWQPTAATVAAAARNAGGRETLVYGDEGYWRVPAGSPPEWLTYRSLLHDQGTVPFMEELQAVYRERPQMILREEFDRLEAAYRQVQALISGEGPVDAESWAQAKLVLDGLPGQVEAIYWRVRLALLNETL